MTAFELFFGLTSVILGLGLTHLANSLQLLMRNRGRVRWAVEPVLQAALILLIIVSVWVDQWHERSADAFTIGQCLLQVVKLLALYIAAAAVLPEQATDEGIDLRHHYYDSRAVTYGALISGLLLFSAYRFIFGAVEFTFASAAENLVLPAIYASLIIFRWRPLHIGILLIVMILFSIEIAGQTIGG